MEDKEATYIYKVVVGYHLSDIDKRGFDGLYIKESIPLPGDTIEALQRKLDIAVEALKEYRHMMSNWNYSTEIADEALKQLEDDNG